MAVVNGCNRCSPPFDSGCFWRLLQMRMKEQSTQSTAKTMTAAITMTINVILLSSPMLCLIPWEDEKSSTDDDVFPVIISPSISGGVFWFVLRTKGLMTAYSPPFGNSSLEYAANISNNLVTGFYNSDVNMYMLEPAAVI